jgi:hypothetical protein
VWPLIVLSGATLATGGSLKLHDPLGHSFDLLGGELLLLSGELLLFAAAVHPARARTNGLRTTLATTCDGRAMVIHF